MATTWSLQQLFATASKENGEDSDTESTGEVFEVGDFRIDTRRHTATGLFTVKIEHVIVRNSSVCGNSCASL